MSRILISLDIETNSPYKVFFREEGEEQFNILRQGLVEDDFPFFHSEIDLPVGTRVEYFIGDDNIDDPLDIKNNDEKEFNNLLFSCVVAPEPELVVDEVGRDFAILDLEEETVSPYRLGRDDSVLLSQDAEFPFREEGLEAETEYLYEVVDDRLQRDDALAVTIGGELVIVTLDAESVTNQAATIGGRIEAVSAINEVDPKLDWGTSTDPFPNVENVPNIENPEPDDQFSSRLDTDEIFERGRFYTGASGISAVAFDPSSNRFAASLRHDQRIRVYNGETKELVDIIKVPLGLGNDIDEIPHTTYDIAFHPDNGDLAVVDSTPILKVYDEDFDIFDQIPIDFDFEFDTTSISWRGSRIAVGSRTKLSYVQVATLIEGSDGYEADSVADISLPNNGHEISDLSWNAEVNRLLVGTNFFAGPSSDEKLVLYDQDLNVLDSSTVDFGITSIDWNNSVAVVGSDAEDIIVYDTSNDQLEVVDSVNMGSDTYTRSNVYARWDEGNIISINGNGDINYVVYEDEELTISTVTESFNYESLKIYGSDNPSTPTSIALSTKLNFFLSGTIEGGISLLEFEGKLDPDTDYSTQARGVPVDNDQVGPSSGDILDFSTNGGNVIETLDIEEVGELSTESDGKLSIRLGGKVNEVLSEISKEVVDTSVFPPEFQKEGGLDFNFALGDSDFEEASNSPTVTRNDGFVRIRNRETYIDALGRVLSHSESTGDGITSNTTSIARNPNNGWIAVGAGDQVLIYDSGFSLLHTIDDADGIPDGVTVNDISWSRKNGRLAVASQGQTNAIQVFVPNNDGTQFDLAADTTGNSDFPDSDFGDFGLVFGGDVRAVAFEQNTGRLALAPTGDSTFDRRVFVYSEDYDEFARLVDTQDLPITRSLDWDDESGRLAVGKAERFTGVGDLLVFSGLNDPNLSFGDVDLTSASDTSEMDLEQFSVPSHDVEWSNNGERLAVAQGASGVVEIRDSNLNVLDTISEVGEINDPFSETSNIYLGAGRSSEGVLSLGSDGSLNWFTHFDEFADSVAVDYQENVFMGSAIGNFDNGVDLVKVDGETGDIIRSISIADEFSDIESLDDYDSVSLQAIEVNPNGDVIIIWVQPQASGDSIDRRYLISKLDNDLQNNEWNTYLPDPSDVHYPEDFFLDHDMDGDIYLMTTYVRPNAGIDNDDIPTKPIIQKYNIDSGEVVWQHRLHEDNGDQGDLAVSDLENAVYSVSKDRGTDGSIIKVDKDNGNEIWKRQQTAADSVTADGAGNVIISEAVLSSEVPDIIKLGAENGEEIWTAALSKSDVRGIAYLKTDSSGDIIVFGRAAPEDDPATPFVEKVKSDGSDTVWIRDETDFSSPDFDFEDVYVIETSRRHTVRNVSFDDETGWLAIPKVQGLVPTSIYDDNLNFVQYVKSSVPDVRDVSWNSGLPIDEDGIKLVSLPYNQKYIEGHKGPVLLKKDKEYFYKATAEGEDLQGNVVSVEGTLKSTTFDS